MALLGALAALQQTRAGAVKDLGHESISDAAVTRLERAGGREVSRVSPSRDEGAAGTVHGDGGASVSTGAAEVSGVGQGGAVRTQPGHENIGAPAVGRLERVGGWKTCRE